VFDSFRGDLAVTRWILASRLTPLRKNDRGMLLTPLRKNDRGMLLTPLRENDRGMLLTPLRENDSFAMRKGDRRRWAHAAARE
jgi:hypothetical protein